VINRTNLPRISVNLLDGNSYSECSDDIVAKLID